MKFKLTFNTFWALFHFEVFFFFFPTEKLLIITSW